MLEHRRAGRAISLLHEQLRAHRVADDVDAALLAEAFTAALGDAQLLASDGPPPGPVLVMTATGLLVHLLDQTGPPLGSGSARSLCGRTPVLTAGAVPAATCNACLNRT